MAISLIFRALNFFGQKSQKTEKLKIADIRI